MIGMIRLGVFGFLFLALVYWLVTIYSRSIRREKLENKWDDDVKTGERDTYVSEGLKSYEDSLRRKLIWLVFVVPIAVVAGLTYVMNFM